MADKECRVCEGHHGPGECKVAAWEIAQAARERRKRVVETARALFIAHVDNFAVVRALDHAESFETAAEKYLKDGAP